jgi:hypothetical protein
MPGIDVGTTITSTMYARRSKIMAKASGDGRWA